MNWRSILIHLAWLVALATALEAGAIWVGWTWFWTPVQRHYLSTYIWCSLPVIAPDVTEASIIWKTGPHHKREIATDEDVESYRTTGMKLSQRALDAGWKGLAEGPAREFQSATLRRALLNIAFDGESPWSFLFLPESFGLVAFGYALYGCFRVGNRLLEWAVEAQWKMPSLDFLHNFAAMARGLQSRSAELRRSATQRTELHRAAMAPNAAQTVPSVKPQTFPFPLFGVCSGTGQGYLWSEKDEIE